MAAIIQTQYGPVRGFLDTHYSAAKSSQGKAQGSQKPVQKYLGIPYGRAGRWQQASAPEPWTETRDCFEYGPTCPQLPSFLEPAFEQNPGWFTRDVGQSEKDMFTVNIYASEGVKSGDNVPTMVWIYGGSWRDGAASNMLYDPSNVIRDAKQPLIVVALNYRVNILGFFATKDLVDENGLVGNYGIRDQLLALKWVNRNITAFGGDKNNVTIYGESAGAGSVGYHIGGIDPLFQRAICQSGAGSTMSFNKVEVHEANWHTLLDHFKIDKNDPDRAEKARALSTDDLLNFTAENPRMLWAACPESGEHAIWNNHPDVRLTKGEWVSSLQSVMTGCCTDEGSIFAESFGMTNSQKVVDRFISAYGEAGKSLAQIYPGLSDVAKHDGSVVDHPASRFLHDALFDGPVRYLAEVLSTTKHKETGKSVDVYLYKSEAILPLWDELGWGVHHFSEIPFVFNASTLWDHDSSRPEAKTAANFGSRWTSFAARGVPGSDWPRYEQGDKIRYVFCNSGEARTERVQEAGTSEPGLLLQAKIIQAKWGINVPSSAQAKL